MKKKTTRILAGVMAFIMLGVSLFGCVYLLIRDVHVTGDHLSERLDAILDEADAMDSRTADNVQEVRMAQLVEYEIENMQTDEVFIVVKTEGGAIVRTIINEPLAEALAKHYK